MKKVKEDIDKFIDELIDGGDIDKAIDYLLSEEIKAYGDDEERVVGTPWKKFRSEKGFYYIKEFKDLPLIDFEDTSIGGTQEGFLINSDIYYTDDFSSIPRTHPLYSKGYNQYDGMYVETFSSGIMVKLHFGEDRVDAAKFYTTGYDDGVPDDGDYYQESGW